ncbi:MAG TPA: hypothetical protein VJR47_05510, partial [Stellaceae bacterium]|nr:hypothetical protein [Stellaceae bacterium]
MALLAPRCLTAPTGRFRFGGLGSRTLLVLAIGLVASAAQAQVTVGGNHPPDVIVDQSVLDQLGPAPTLPQLFGAHGASESRGEAPDLRPHPAVKPSHSGAKAKKTAKTHKPVHRKQHPTASAHKVRPAHKLEAKRQPAVHAAPSRQTAAKSPPAPQGSKPAAAPPGIAIDAPPPP